MIQLEHITLRRGVEDLLEDASLVVHAGQKVGLVGPNGCGKSSLFAMLLGELEPDTGEVRIPEDWTVAHLAQQIRELDRPAIEYVLDGDTALRRAEREVAEADASGDGERIAHAHQAFDDAQGFDAPARAGAGRGVEALRIVERLVRVRNPLAIAGSVGLGHLALGPAQRSIAVEHIFDRRAVQLADLLGQVGHGPVLGNANFAGIGLQLAQQHCEQAGLAAAVGANQADLLAGVHDKACILQQVLDAAA